MERPPRGSRLPRRLRAPVLIALAALLATGVAQLRRDTVPPRLYLEVPERVAAGEPLELRVSADEPVTYRLLYGAAELEEVAQNLTVTLSAQVGDVPLEVVAVDGAGNESREVRSVRGVAPFAPVLELPAEVGAGSAFGLLGSWRPTGAELREVRIEVAGEGLEPLRVPDGAVALALVELGHEDAVWPVRLLLRDEFGRESVAEGEVRVVADRRPVEQLNLSGETLSLITPEAREREAAALAAGYAQAEPLPLWREPWLVPIDGRSTSGYGHPRRYAPGGRVSRHNGADIGAPTGTPVRAANTGVVRVADTFPIKGGFVMIDHGGGVFSLYLHLSAVHAEAGQRVERGATIGEVGSTGLSTGPHLHWEVRLDGRPTDPMAWAGRVLPHLDAGDPLAGLEPAVETPGAGGE